MADTDKGPPEDAVEWPLFEELDECFQRLIAIHEAAHAVAVFHFGSRDVYIEQTDPPVWAHTVCRASEFNDDTAHAVFVMVGGVAEWIDQRGGPDDPEDPGPELDDLLKYLIASFRLKANFVHDPKTKVAVERMALYVLGLPTEWWEEIELVASEFLSAGGHVSAERMSQILMPYRRTYQPPSV